MVYNCKHIDINITYNNETVVVFDNNKYVGLMLSSKSGILQDHLPYTEQCDNKATFALKAFLR